MPQCAARVSSTLEVAPDQPAQQGGRELSLDCRFDPQQRALIHAEHPTVADRCRMLEDLGDDQQPRRRDARGARAGEPHPVCLRSPRISPPIAAKAERKDLKADTH